MDVDVFGFGGFVWRFDDFEVGFLVFWFVKVVFDVVGV